MGVCVLDCNGGPRSSEVVSPRPPQRDSLMFFGSLANLEFTIIVSVRFLSPYFAVHKRRASTCFMLSAAEEEEEGAENISSTITGEFKAC